MTSCELHDMQDPHELKASMTASQCETSSSRTSCLAGRAGLGLARRMTSATPYRPLSNSSSRSRNKFPLGNPMSSRPTVFPRKLVRRGASDFVACLPNPMGSRISSAITFPPYLGVVYPVRVLPILPVETDAMADRGAGVEFA